jgi:histone H3/H4
MDMDNQGKLLLRQETIHQILKENFTNSKTKVNNNTLKIIRKYIEVLITETIHRTIEQAKIEDSPTVELLHFERILPQMVKCHVMICAH